MCPDGKEVADVLGDILLVCLVHRVDKALVYGMPLTEGDDTAAGLDEEHIEYLAVKACHILLHKLSLEDKGTKRRVAADRLGTEDKGGRNVDEIALLCLDKFGADRNGKTAARDLY